MISHPETAAAASSEDSLETRGVIRVGIVLPTPNLDWSAVTTKRNLKVLNWNPVLPFGLLF